MGVRWAREHGGERSRDTEGRGHGNREGERSRSWNTEGRGHGNTEGRGHRTGGHSRGRPQGNALFPASFFAPAPGSSRGDAWEWARRCPRQRGCVVLSSRGPGSHILPGAPRCPGRLSAWPGRGHGGPPGSPVPQTDCRPLLVQHAEGGEAPLPAPHTPSPPIVGPVPAAATRTSCLGPLQGSQNGDLIG